MQIHLIQLDIIWEDKPANFAKIETLLEKSAQNIHKGDIIVLPEMFATGFAVKPGELAEGLDGQLAETDDFLAELAQKYACLVIGGGISKDSQSELFLNVARAWEPNGLLGSFEKLHPFSFGKEHLRFKGGQYRPGIQWNGFAIMPFICYDLRFPEVFRKALDDQRTELFIVIANWPEARSGHWQTLLKARAIENQAWVAGVNRYGQDPWLKYSGDSMVVDPLGEEVGHICDQEAILSVKIERERLDKWRNSFSAIDDRRSL